VVPLLIDGALRGVIISRVRPLTARRAGDAGWGHTFDVSVNAEGVERRTQVERLHELGCELAQGRSFASPRPAADISRLLLSGGLPVPTTVTEV
jgi:hypothetical protein